MMMKKMLTDMIRILFFGLLWAVPTRAQRRLGYSCREFCKKYPSDMCRFWCPNCCDPLPVGIQAGSDEAAILYEAQGAVQDVFKHFQWSMPCRRALASPTADARQICAADFTRLQAETEEALVEVAQAHGFDTVPDWLRQAF